MKKYKICYRCRNCKNLNDTRWKGWANNSKPTKCRHCQTLNHFVNRKVRYLKYIIFLPTKYFNVYKKFIAKHKNTKKQKLVAMGPKMDSARRLRIGRKISRKIDNAYLKINVLSLNRERVTISELEKSIY